MIRRNESEGGWALLENGYIHTSELNKEDAEEMLERHARIFDNMEWSIVFIDN